MNDGSRDVDQCLEGFQRRITHLFFWSKHMSRFQKGQTRYLGSSIQVLRATRGFVAGPCSGSSATVTAHDNQQGFWATNRNTFGDTLKASHATASSIAM